MQPGIASLLLPQAGHLTGRSPHAGTRSGNGPWIAIRRCPPGTARPTAARQGGQARAEMWRCHCSVELAAMGHPDPYSWPAAAGVSLHEDMAQRHQLIPPVRHTGLYICRHRIESLRLQCMGAAASRAPPAAHSAQHGPHTPDTCLRGAAAAGLAS